MTSCDTISAITKNLTPGDIPAQKSAAHAAMAQAEMEKQKQTVSQLLQSLGLTPEQAIEMQRQNMA